LDVPVHHPCRCSIPTAICTETVARSKVSAAGIIPGDWGTIEPGWLVQSLEWWIAGFTYWRQHSPAPLAGVAARHNAMEELGGEGR
jgi:hypothetical protein